MKKILGIFTAMICSLCVQSSIYAQQTSNNPEKPLVVKEGKVLPIKDVKSPELFKPQRGFKPEIKMPHRVRKAFDVFKFADELDLTDEQMIQLRCFYRKHYSVETEKKEVPIIPNTLDFYAMSDEELLKYADNEAMKTKKRIMSRLQKIIDIRKILTPEQIEKIKEEAVKESERSRKELEAKMSKKPLPPNKEMKPAKPFDNCHGKKCDKNKPGKHHKSFQPNMNGWFMNPMWNYQPGMMAPQFPPMGFQPGMMNPPFNPMGHCPGMMPFHHMGFKPNMMAPMGKPSHKNHKNKMPGFPPMFSRPNMMGPNMGPMFNCPNMMNPNMGPMCMKNDKPKCKKCHDDKHHMMPMNKKDKKFNHSSKDFAHEHPKSFPFAKFLIKFLSCQKDHDSDIINK